MNRRFASGRRCPPARDHVRFGAALCTAVLLVSPRAAAQENDEVQARINYVYATQFGFGGYKVGGLNANVYQLPIAFTVDDVIGSWDLEIGLPITYGDFGFSTSVDVPVDREDGTREVENFFVRVDTNTIGIEPRLQLDIPIHALPGLRVSPFGAFGFGTTFDTSGSARSTSGARTNFSFTESQFYTYQIGVTSLYTYPWNDFTFLLGNAFLYAGDATFGGGGDLGDDVEGYGTFRTGIEVRYPLGFTFYGIAPDVGAFFVYNLFTPSLQFTRVARRTLEIDEIFELGATVGAAKPYEISWLPRVLNDALDEFRIGIGYQTGQRLDGVRVTFGVPF